MKQSKSKYTKYKEIGIRFDNLQAATQHVQTEARLDGFSLYKRTQTEEALFLYCTCSRSVKESHFAKGKKAVGKVRKSTSFRCKCPYNVRINLVDGKWVPRYPVDMQHNHPALNNLEALVYPSNRKLNEEQLKTFDVLAATDASNTSIAANLAPLGSNPILRVDIKNLRARKLNALDQGDNIDKLRPLLQLLESNDYITSLKVDSENRLTHLFFAHSSAVELVRRYPDMLIVDATYKTNVFDLPLMNAIGVSSVYGTHYGEYKATGTTRALKNFQIALAWTSDETTESYEWFFSQLKEKLYLNKEPEAIVTDRCKRVRGGANAVFPSAGKLLCSWHIINKNLFENCKKSFTDADYKQFDIQVREMQRCRNEEELEAARIKLFAFCDKHSPKNSKASKDYITSLLKEKEHWVKCYVDKYPHMGNYTSGRIESQHASLKGNMKAIFSMEKAFKTFDETIKGQFIDLTVEIGREKTLLPYFVDNTKQFDEMKRKVSHFAIDLIKSQIASHYEEKMGDKPVRECTGFLKNVYRLPCRHAFDPEDVDTAIPINLVGERWLLDEKVDSAVGDDTSITASQLVLASNVSDARANIYSALYEAEDALSLLSSGDAIEYANQLRAWSQLVKQTGNVVPLKPARQISKSEAKNTKRIPLKSERMIAEMKREEQAVFDFSQEQRQPVEVPKVVVLPDSLQGSIPSFMLPSLLAWIDVEKDGKCGFRACLAAQGLNECHWIGVRRALLAILEQKEEHYLKTVFVNSPEDLNDFRDSLVWFKKGCSIEKYMVMPHAGYLIADHYRTPVHFYSKLVKMTFLPSNTPEARKAISIVHESYDYQDQFGNQVHSGHYTALMVKDDSPIPPIAPHCRFAKAWRNVLGERVKLWKKKDKVSQRSSAKAPSKSRKARITVESSDDEQDYDNVGMISNFEDKNTENAAKDEEKIILPMKRKSARIEQNKPKSFLKAAQLEEMDKMLKNLAREDPAELMKDDGFGKCIVCLEVIINDNTEDAVLDDYKKKYDEFGYLIEQIEDGPASRRQGHQKRKRALFKLLEKDCERHRLEGFVPLIEKYNCKALEFNTLRDRTHEALKDLLPELLTNEYSSPFTERLLNVYRTCQRSTLIPPGATAMGMNPEFFGIYRAPGYYGEVGSSIILETLGHTTLRKQYKATAFFAKHGITFEECNLGILLPEITLKLIKQDQNVSHDRAYKIYTETIMLGIALYPEGDYDKHVK